MVQEVPDDTLLLFFQFSGERWVESGSLLAGDHMHPKYPLNVQLIRISCFGEVREQTKKVITWLKGAKNQQTVHLKSLTVQCQQYT